MKLAGIQKLTLLDYPGKMACIVFTGGCNFRCPFCHNAGLVLGNDGADEDIDAFFEFLKKRKNTLDGVVVTGGEPLLQPDIKTFLRQIKELEYSIKLDTNGTKPKLLEELVAEGLVDYVAMDIKHAPEEYGKAVGLKSVDMDAITASKDFLLKGHVPYEFRTTVVGGIHTEENLVALAKWITGAKEYYLQQFKDSGNLIAPDGLYAYSEQEMSYFAEKLRTYVPSVRVRGI